MTTTEPDEADLALDAAFAAIAADPDEAEELAAGMLPLRLREAIVDQSLQIARARYPHLPDGAERYSKLLLHPAAANRAVFALAAGLAADPDVPLDRALGTLDLIDHQPRAGSGAN